MCTEAQGQTGPTEQLDGDQSEQLNVSWTAAKKKQ